MQISISGVCIFKIRLGQSWCPEGHLCQTSTTELVRGLTVCEKQATPFLKEQEIVKACVYVHKEFVPPVSRPLRASFL